MKYLKVKRIIDLMLAILFLVLLSPLILITYLLVRFTSYGPAIYWSDRYGQNNKIFQMPKFRTMKINTPVIATHLLQDPRQYLTCIGGFLRKASLDELPQLWSILTGDMSFVGPRPALFNQTDLVNLRTQHGIQHLMPGLTGWAQINGRDDISTIDKVKYDFEYLNQISLFFDFKILGLTLLKVLALEGVAH